jgi:hypothetical protein
LQLGYPTKNALKGWHREYEKCLDLPVGFRFAQDAPNSIRDATEAVTAAGSADVVDLAFDDWRTC